MRYIQIEIFKKNKKTKNTIKKCTLKILVNTIIVYDFYKIKW